MTVGVVRKPHSIRELHPYVVGGGASAVALARSCEAEILSPDDWAERPFAPAPEFLLVEAGEDTGASWDDELDRLLERCERADIPRLLWIASSPVESRWLRRVGKFDRVFTMDREQLPQLEAAGARMPATLWPATDLPIEAPETSEGRKRSCQIVWLGGWRRDWPAPWRERLTGVLRGAARRGLRIHPIADLDGLPADLWQCVRGSPAVEAQADLLGEAVVVIGADARVGALAFAPQIAFDAVARGAVVITPHGFSSSLHEFTVGTPRAGTLRLLMPPARNSRTTLERLDGLLGDPETYDEIAGLMRQIVANNHTYAHRLATLASTTGHRLVPDAQDPAPA